MTPQAAIDAYRRALTDRISITRTPRTGDPSSASDVSAQVRFYRPEEIAGAIQQGDREVIVLKDELDRQGFPCPPHPDDKLRDGDGKALTVKSCDANTRRVAQTTIAYILQCRG